jgi:hypothetical protein
MRTSEPESTSAVELGRHERLDAGRITERRLIEMVFPEQTNHYATPAEQWSRLARRRRRAPPTR